MHFQTQYVDSRRAFMRPRNSYCAIIAFFLLTAALSAGNGVFAAQNRLLLVDQSNDYAKRGFSLRLENQTDGDDVCTLATLKLVFALGDGKSWHYLVSPAGQWQTGRDYVARAVVSKQQTRLFVNDAQAATGDPAQIAPAGQAAISGVQPDWAGDPADYIVVPLSFRLTDGSEHLLQDRFNVRSLPQLLLDAQTGRRYISLTLAPGAAFTIESTFRLVPRPSDLSSIGPVFDATGQAIAARWPGQSRTDADFQRDKLLEAKRLTDWRSAVQGSSYDEYGGWRGAGWHASVSSAFRVARHAGRWWLLTPDGNPCFYKGIDTAPALEWEQTPITGRESLFAALPPRRGATASAWGSNPWGSDPGTDYVAFCAVNLLHKYGANWRSAFTRLTRRRLKAWGFSGMGKWSAPIAGVCDWPVLSRGGVPALAGHPDPFDPATATALRQNLAAQIAPRLHDKTVVAWTLGNEHDEIVTAAEIKTILGMAASVPAKQALIGDALDTLYGGDSARLAAAWNIARAPAQRDALYASTRMNPPANDLEKLREFYESRYYALIYGTIKSIDPSHLYAGFWIVPGWWENDSDWSIIAAHCDLIGYDHYSFQFTDAKLAAEMRQTAKPVFCGEFSFPPSYNGERGFGVYDQAWSAGDADAGSWYAKTLRAAAANPYCVGIGWFQYRDEPQSGRGPGHGPNLIYGEHYAFGAVTIADQPKWALITAMRAANLSADKLRAAPTGSPSHLP